MKRSLTYFALVSTIVLFYNKYTIAWDDKVTHKDLSQYAADNSDLSIYKGNFLKKIAFENGLNEKYVWNGKVQSIMLWLREGAQLEDEGTKLDALKGNARFNNHFHNPQKPWESAGLNDIQTGESALLWAQDGVKQMTKVGGDWSWGHIRDLYRLALTAATDGERQAYFAQTFRGLGQQMHLIQDMSVPYHVRNDAHPLDSLLNIDPQFGSRYFETWAKEHPDVISALAATPNYPALSFSASPYGLVPITQLFDTTKYAVTPPSNSLDIGLAEYTNENYFSDDTIFAAEAFAVDDKHYSPFPKQSSTNV